MIETIGRDGEVTIPPEIRDAARLDEGDEVEFEVTENGMLIRFYEEELPDPWYDDTPEWQEGLERTLGEADQGIGTIYESGAAFLEALERMSKNADLPG